jgi:hypothetical protein
MNSPQSISNIALFLLLFPMVTWSQQNLINVPAAEATEKNKIFFQQQFNFNELVQSNTTFDYGLGKGFELGVNVLGLNFSEKRRSFLQNDTSDVDPYNPLLLCNVLKQFNLGKNMSLATGAQSGLNFDFNKKYSPAGLIYANLLLKNLVLKDSRFTGGLYYNSIHYGGGGNRLGVWLGAEVPLSGKFHLLAESILGDNAISYTSTGLVYYPRKWLPLTLGIQVPNTAKNSYALVFELTYISSAK